MKRGTAVIPADVGEKSREVERLVSMKLLRALAVFMNSGTNICWPSRDTLMREAGIPSTTSFYAAIGELTRLGIITKQSRARQRGGMEIVYRWILSSEPIAQSVSNRDCSEREQPATAQSVSNRGCSEADTTGCSEADTTGCSEAEHRTLKGTPKGTQKEYVESSDELRLASLLQELIIKNNPKAKTPNLQTWCKDVGLLIRINKRTPEEIETIIRWSQADPFWCSNILSPAKLRKQFDQLTVKRRREKGDAFGREEDRKQAERVRANRAGGDSADHGRNGETKTQARVVNPFLPQLLCILSDPDWWTKQENRLISSLNFAKRSTLGTESDSYLVSNEQLERLRESRAEIHMSEPELTGIGTADSTSG